MGLGGSWGWLAVALAAALVACTSAQGSGSGGGIPSCATKLAACANYLNATTTPPDTCCNPLKETVNKERPCLCGIFNNSALLQTFQINITQILGLPKLCKIDIPKDPTALCKGVAPSPSSTSTGSSTATPSAGTGSSTTSGTGSGSSGTKATNGAAETDKQIRLLVSLLVFCVYVMFY